VGCPREMTASCGCRYGIGGGGGPVFPWGELVGIVSVGHISTGRVGWKSRVSMVSPALYKIGGRRWFCPPTSGIPALWPGPRCRGLVPCYRNCDLLSALAVRISSTGHLAGLRLWGSPFGRLCVVTNRMCPVGIRMSVSMLALARIAVD